MEMERVYIGCAWFPNQPRIHESLEMYSFPNCFRRKILGRENFFLNIFILVFGVLCPNVQILFPDIYRY